MLGPRYDEQVAEENRFHPSMLSNYLKSLKVKLYFLIIETLPSLLVFTQVLLFRFKEKVVNGFVWDTCTEFFVCLFTFPGLLCKLIDCQKCFLTG